jgi:excisionase family DNA binding protein
MQRVTTPEVYMNTRPGTHLSDLDPLWNAADVAQFLKVSKSWVYQKVEAGVLPHLRIGSMVRFDPAAIRAFAQAGARR